MRLIEMEALPATEADRVVMVPWEPGHKVTAGERVVLHTAGGEYFSGRVCSRTDVGFAYLVEVLGRLPEDLALRRVGKVVDLTPAARREAASLQELVDLLGAARLAAGSTVPAQARPQEDRPLTAR